MRGGHYCRKCGTVQPLSAGLVTCRRCGGLGLWAFEGRRPTRIRCPHTTCDWTGWADRVNDDLGRHLRTAHRHEPAPG